MRKGGTASGKGKRYGVTRTHRENKNRLARPFEPPIELFSANWNVGSCVFHRSTGRVERSSAFGVGPTATVGPTVSTSPDTHLYCALQASRRRCVSL